MEINLPVSKFYPLELSEDASTAAAQGVGCQKDHTTDIPLTENCPSYDTAQCSRKRLAECTKIVRAPAKDC